MSIVSRARTAATVVAALAVAAMAGGAGAARLPSSLLAVPADGGTVHVLVAEKSTQSLHLHAFDRSGGRLVRTLPATTGKVRGDKLVEGDLKTPEGAYWFVRAIDGDALPPLYGAGAFVMDYPNVFDRLDGKTGSGIWLHGVETDDRVYVARDTRGCVAIRNDHFDQIRPLLRLHETPIVVVEQVDLVEQEILEAEADQVRAFVEAWRSAWEDGDLDRYLAHYGREFRSDGKDLAAWGRWKREIAEREPVRRIALGPATILREKDRLWIAFRQEYAASGHRDVGRKTLFVRGDGPGRWRIVGETWRPVGGGFRELRPEELPERRPLSEAQVAAMAPDAAPAGAVPATTPGPAVPEVPRETGASPAEEAATAEPPGPGPSVSPPAAEPSAPVAEPQAPPSEAAPGQPEPGPETPAPETAEAPRAAAPAPAAAVPPPARPAAALAEPATTRGVFELLGPHVRRDGDSLVLQVQLLNRTPSISRKGSVALTHVGGPPEAAPEPFLLRQGQLLTATLPSGTASVRVVVRDESGGIALDQEITIGPRATR